jgi:hypothetical protein
MTNLWPGALNNYTGLETLSQAQHAQEHNALESALTNLQHVSTFIVGKGPYFAYNTVESVIEYLVANPTSHINGVKIIVREGDYNISQILIDFSTLEQDTPGLGGIIIEGMGSHATRFMQTVNDRSAFVCQRSGGTPQPIILRGFMVYNASNPSYSGIEIASLTGVSLENIESRGVFHNYFYVSGSNDNIFFDKCISSPDSFVKGDSSCAIRFNQSDRSRITNFRGSADIGIEIIGNANNITSGDFEGCTSADIKLGVDGTSVANITTVTGCFLAGGGVDCDYGINNYYGNNTQGFFNTFADTLGTPVLASVYGSGTIPTAYNYGM